MDRLEKIKWLVNNPNPCDKCIQSSSCCGCQNYFEWKAKFDKLNIDANTKEEAYNVRKALSFKKYLENISEEAKKAFNL